MNFQNVTSILPFCGDADVWLRFWSWCLVEILKIKICVRYELNPRVRCAFGNVFFAQFDGSFIHEIECSMQWYRHRPAHRPSSPPWSCWSPWAPCPPAPGLPLALVVLDQPLDQGVPPLFCLSHPLPDKSNLTFELARSDRFNSHVDCVMKPLDVFWLWGSRHYPFRLGHSSIVNDVVEHWTMNIDQATMIRIEELH